MRGRAEQLLASLVPERGAPTQEMTTGLSVLAFLGAGYSHLSRDRLGGRVAGEVVRAGLRWIIARQGEDGGIGPRPESGVCEGNVLPALALSEAYGLTGSAHFKDRTQAAVDFVAARQRESGAWGPGRDDTMCTFWALTLLKSAELSGLSLAASVLRRGVDRLANIERPDVLEAAAYCAVARFAGVPPDTRRFAARVESVIPAKSDGLVLALTTMARFEIDGPGGERWRAWGESVKPVLRRRAAVGSGCDQGSVRGRAWPTALNAVTLQVTYRTPSGCDCQPR